MSRRNGKRAAILNRLNKFFHVRQFLKAEEVSASEVADALLRFEAQGLRAFGGPPQYTGNNRAFANGANAYEVRCRKCKRAFWVTTLPYALCPDCDGLWPGR